ncbi:hypothetical protein DPSP01_013067 [Paraphaeosphaeria sporulosa]
MRNGSSGHGPPGSWSSACCGIRLGRTQGRSSSCLRIPPSASAPRSGCRLVRLYPYQSGGSIVGFGLRTNADTCGGTGHKFGDDDDCWNTGYEFAAPFPRNDSALDVTNLKTLAQKGLSNSVGLPQQIANAVSEMQADTCMGHGFGLIDAVGPPITMIVQGEESTSLVVQTAEKIEEEQRKAIILAFVSAILVFIPIVGEILSTVAETADIAGTIAVLAAAGHAAFDVYTIVDDPKNASLAIFNLIMAPLALADVAVVAEAAQIRRKSGEG